MAAIGSPFGERQSLSVGVISAIDRSIASLTDFEIPGAIQTDAAINPGNSGGPLVDADGRVIGINQQIKTNSGGGEGVGFAVPIDVVKRSLAQLRDDGKAHYAYLGVSSVAALPAARRAASSSTSRRARGCRTSARAARPSRPGCTAAAAEQAFQAAAFRRAAT